MSRWQAKLEKKQAVLGHIVDIGAELYAISTAAVYAQTLRKEHPEAGDEAFELADLFIRQARRRVDLLGELFSNDDDADYAPRNTCWKGATPGSRRASPTCRATGRCSPRGPRMCPAPAKREHVAARDWRQRGRAVSEGTAGRFRRKETQAAIDWRAIEGSPEFQELVKERRSFLVPATIVFLVGSVGYLLLAAFANDFMSTLVAGMPMRSCRAHADAMTWITTWLYMRVADSTLEPLERRRAAPIEGRR